MLKSYIVVMSRRVVFIFLSLFFVACSRNSVTNDGSGAHAPASNHSTVVEAHAEPNDFHAEDSCNEDEVHDCCSLVSSSRQENYCYDPYEGGVCTAEEAL